MIHQYFQQATNDPFIPIDASSLTHVMMQSFQLAYTPYPDKFFIRQPVPAKQKSLWYEWWLYSEKDNQSIGLTVLPICWDIDKRRFTLPYNENSEGIDSLEHHPVTQLIEQAKRTNTLPVCSFYCPYKDKWRSSEDLKNYSSLEEDTWTFIRAWEFYEKIAGLPSSEWFSFYSLADIPFSDLLSPQSIREDDQSLIEFIAENAIGLLGRDFEDCTIGPPPEELNQQTLIHSTLPDHVLNAVLNVPSLRSEGQTLPQYVLLTMIDEEE